MRAAVRIAVAVVISLVLVATQAFAASSFFVPAAKKQKCSCTACELQCCVKSQGAPGQPVRAALPQTFPTAALVKLLPASVCFLIPRATGFIQPVAEITHTAEGGVPLYLWHGGQLI